MAKETITNVNIIDFTEELYLLGKVPISEKTAEPLVKIEQRCEEYYEVCKKYNATPMVEGLALILGISREELLEWATGKQPWTRGEIAEFIRQQISRLNLILVAANQYGLLRDIPTIFWGKNNFGYQNEDQKKVMEIQIAIPTKEQLIEQSKNLEIVQK